MVKSLEFRFLGFELLICLRRIAEEPPRFDRYRLGSRENSRALRASLLNGIAARLKE